MPKVCLFLCLFLLATVLQLGAQANEKKVLTHEDIARWKTIEDETLSFNGRWVAYQLRPHEGDPAVVLYDGNTRQERTFARAQKPAFSADNRYLVVQVRPPEDSLKAMRRGGKEKEELPGDTLYVVDLQNPGQGPQTIPGIASFDLPEKWPGWLIYRPKVLPDTSLSEQEQKMEPFIILSLNGVDTFRFSDVMTYATAEEAQVCLFAQTDKDSTIAPGVYFWRAGQDPATIFPYRGKFHKAALSKDGRRAAFVTDLNTSKMRHRPYELFYWGPNLPEARPALQVTDNFLPVEYQIDHDGELQFSETGERVFFALEKKPLLQDTTLLEEEIVEVEVWNYQDAYLYTQQEVQLQKDELQKLQAVYLPQPDKLVRLNDGQFTGMVMDEDRNGRYAIGYDERPYLQAISWAGFPAVRDIYKVEINTGDTDMIAKGVMGRPKVSPKGEYAYWFSRPDTAWYAYSFSDNKTRQLTNNLEVAFYDELYDQPMYPGSYGSAGWTIDDDFFIVYDRYDAWLLDPRGGLAPNNLTNSREEKRICRYIEVDPEAQSIDEVKPMLFHFRDEDTKEEGYFYFNIHTGTKDVVESGPYQYSRRPVKARTADQWLFVRENFQTFPDLLYGNSLNNYRTISQANPQQSDYRWGTIEPYSWTSLKGEPLEGLLIKPEGFDPDRQYPMITYFYERYSDRLHNHWTPDYGRSIINFSQYASKGYVIFIPDIPYEVGYPGKSAYDAVLPGVTSLLEKGFIDPDRIGVQGHSWGGYQSAYLITQTDIFACAESGAPVVNMTSAYGGIRWGTGLSRMFQYERTQSRIGGSIWEEPRKYIENSPLFYIDKINTPVLILHNDEDGAVPWYQGIEFFVAMRRLGKPAWLLNYNNEPHWPSKYQNRKDFQLRMGQFFDHYLMGQPMPGWMKKGVSPQEKGIEQGYSTTEGE